MPRLLLRTASLFLLLVFAATTAWAQTGKVSGQVTDFRTGEGLPGINVLVDGTTRGATTDIDGFYAIIGLQAGTIRLRVSAVGYATQIVENVRVNIGQTTTINLKLREEEIEGQEVTVTAERPVVETDVSSSRTNVTAEQLERLPIANITSAIALQAGVEGLSVRGSGTDELQFNLNGLTLRDERTGTAYTGIPISSVQEVQLVTGGFNAEYGNVRSGLINVVTKEGDRYRYSLDTQLRLTPAASKTFGVTPNSDDAYFIRPFVDPAVAFTGTTNGAWDTYTQDSYPAFGGWIAESERRIATPSTKDDMTPEALYQAFLYQHRKTFKITQPDYNIDVGVGGPVPLLNRFGGTRFYAALKRDQAMYFIPLSRDRFAQQTFTGKVTTDLTKNVKLSVESLYGAVEGTASSRAGQPGVFSSTGMSGQFTGDSKIISGRLFGTDYWAPVRTRDFMLGARLAHILSPKAFYEVRLTRYASFYDVTPNAFRDTSTVISFGGTGFDEGPYGLAIGPSTGVEGMSMGLGFSTTRDTSRTAAYNLKGDYTNQLTRAIEVKTGFEYNLTRSQINYGQYDAYLQSGNFNTRWDRSPTRAAAYAQTKLEYRGLIANLGLRLDQSHASGTWYDLDNFSSAFLSAERLDTARQSPTKRLVTLSPRLGVSFPITTASKLFVNYGHFRSLPNPNDLYQVSFLDQTRKVTRIADPNAPLPKTIAYEVGYEQEVLKRFLVRATGYYKNTFFEPLTVSYSGFGSNSVAYSKSEPNGYADTRGFELTFEKRRGRILNGFVNYTYMVASSGRFGLPVASQNPTTQRENEQNDGFRRSSEFRPLAQPYGRMGLNVRSPNDFGPSVAGGNPLGGWLAAFVGTYRAGAYTTWIDGGGSREDVVNNLRFVNFTNLDLRLARDFRVANRRVQFFADISNLLNQKRLSTNGFSDTPDRNRYFSSLRLPEAEKKEYTNIPGDDRPGTYRRSGVAYQPMFPIANRATFSGADPKAIYFERTSGEYLTFANGAWQAVDSARLQQVLDDKAYIDMPNQSFLTFFNPRAVFFGLRLNL